MSYTRNVYFITCEWFCFKYSYIVYLFVFCIYVEGPRQMSYRSLGLPSYNKAIIIIYSPPEHDRFDVLKSKCRRTYIYS